MKLLKSLSKKTGKSERERKVLLSLIEHYIKTGKPVGSNTLKDVEFADLSSATIRNYFANLDAEGYLLQQHTSGGRIPTDKAYRLYAEEACQSALQADLELDPNAERLRSGETREIAAFLQHAAEKLSEKLQIAVFLSAPRFEQDFIIGIKLISIDTERCLCVLITDFGDVKTEILHVGIKLSSFTIKHLECYFNWRLAGQNKPDNLTSSEEELGIQLYKELMMRYIVSYSRFEQEEMYRTGFSTLLNYPEFHDPSILAKTLGLFENTQGMRLLLKEASKLDTLKFWIGDDLLSYSSEAHLNCAVIATPYHVNHQPVGAIGLLGPNRLPYPQAFHMLRQFSANITHTLTNSLYKFKINLRQPKQETIDLKQKNLSLIGQTQRLLLPHNQLTQEGQPKSSNPTHRRK